MKKKLLALICALALVFSLVSCTISAPDTVGSIGDFEITSGMYLLAQYGAYQQAAQLAGTDQDATDVKAFLKETITTDSDSGETAVVSDYVAQKTQETLETLAAVDARFKALGGELTDEQIAHLAAAINDVKMFNVSLSADELKAIFACKPEAIVRSNNNRLVAFFFSGLSSRGLITPNWQSVIANHKLFLSKDTSRDKYINQSDLSTATNYIRDVGVEGKYATLEKYLMQVKRL